MFITRHNYEEFFLLLADGELSPAHEEVVLKFVKQHPDLAEELELMMDCRLEAEVPPIFPKEKLLKPITWNVDEPDEIQTQLLELLDGELGDEERIALEKKIMADASLQLEWETLKTHGRLEAEPAPVFPKEKLLKPTIWNVDEPDTVYVQMMTMLDNELPAAEKAVLEDKIAADKALQIEWQSLQKARLVAAGIVFPNKESLYREKEQRRIGGWIRWAAAAAVIFGAGWFFWPKTETITTPGMATNTQNGSKNNGIKVSPQKENNSQTTNPGETVNKVENSQAPVANTKNETTNSLASVNSSKSEKLSSNEKTTNRNKPTLSRQQSLAVNDDVRNSNTIASISDGANETDPVSPRVRSVITGNTGNNDEMKHAQPRQLSSIPANSQHNKNDLFRTASYKEDVTDNGSDDDVVYIAGARLNKQKVRGVFRGITRSLSRSFTKSKVEPDNEAPALSRGL
ncbi:MAG: hypothetical protein V4722_10065 [Bacteroidota bacterium]